MTKFILDREKREIPSNPPIEFAEKILKEAKLARATSITSIGGGSTIDVGKYVAWKLNISHTAIPTTAGTGSEVTKFAVFIDKGRKVSLEDNGLIPDNFILDSSRIVSLPPLQTASSGFDALCQGIESYWSPVATNKSRHYAKLAFKTASKHLLSSYHHPYSETLRMGMLYAANYSGEAINITRTSICHAISYPITLTYDVPHGIACAITLPYFIKYFNFRFIKPTQIEKIMKLTKINNYSIVDKEMIADEALRSIRSQNTPKKVDKQTIINALNYYEKMQTHLPANDGGSNT